MKERLKLLLARAGILDLAQRIYGNVHPAGRHIRRDYSQWRRSCEELVGGLAPASSGMKRLLIIGLHDFLPTVKMESFLAKALQSKGYKLAVLLYRRQYWARLYYRIFGIKEFYFFDDF